MNKITIVGRQEPEGLPQASIGVEIKFHFSDDAPASLVAAVGQSVAEILTAWGRPDELEKIAEECASHARPPAAAGRPRRADAAGGRGA